MSKTHLSTVFPIRDRVVVFPMEHDTKHDPVSPIYMPDSVKQDTAVRGLVEEVGPGFLTGDGKQIPLGVAVGDVVIFDKSAGRRITSYQRQLVILREQEILAIERAPK